MKTFDGNNFTDFVQFQRHGTLLQHGLEAYLNTDKKHHLFLT
jgi:hypothetical protein